MTDHYRALLRMDQDESVRVGHVLTLLAVYMVREEKTSKFSRIDIVRETKLPRSSVYRIINEFVEEGILTETNGEFECNTHTPDFLTNPEEFYGRELDTLTTDENDIIESMRREFQILSTRLENAIAAEISRLPQGNFTPGINPEGFAPAPIKPKEKPKDILDEVEDEGELDDSVESQLGEEFFL